MGKLKEGSVRKHSEAPSPIPLSHLQTGRLFFNLHPEGLLSNDFPGKPSALN
jgi:hypothetical protein